MINEGVEGTIEKILEISIPQLREFESIREEVLRLVRELISDSSKAIEACRRGDRERAHSYLYSAKERLNACLNASLKLDRMERIYNLVRDGEKEFIEASLTYSYVFNEGVEEFMKGLKLNPESIVLGVMEFTGELRRIFLEKLISKDFKEAEKIISLLRNIQSKIIFSDLRMTVIPSLRRRLDLLRTHIEKSLEDLNFSIKVDELQRVLANRDERGT